MQKALLHPVTIVDQSGKLSSSFYAQRLILFCARGEKTELDMMVEGTNREERGLSKEVFEN